MNQEEIIQELKKRMDLCPKWLTTKPLSIGMVIEANINCVFAIPFANEKQLEEIAGIIRDSVNQYVKSNIEMNFSPNYKSSYYFPENKILTKIGEISDNGETITHKVHKI